MYFQSNLNQLNVKNDSLDPIYLWLFNQFELMLVDACSFFDQSIVIPSLMRGINERTQVKAKIVNVDNHGR